MQWIRKNWIRILRILSAYLLFIFAGEVDKYRSLAPTGDFFGSYFWNMNGFFTAGGVLIARFRDRWTNPDSRRMQNRTRLLIRFYRFPKRICHLTFRCLELEVMSVKSWRDLKSGTGNGLRHHSNCRKVGKDRLFWNGKKSDALFLKGANVKIGELPNL